MKNLSTKKIEKYSRQIIMKEVGINGQKKICRSSICIVGCGGLGTSAAQYLTMTGVENITLIDYDVVELSNINRQTLFFEEDKLVNWSKRIDSESNDNALDEVKKLNKEK